MALSHLHLPLLVRELIGMANRRSTYAIRMACAALVLISTIAVLENQQGQQLFGQGLRLFLTIQPIQVALALLAVPMISALGIATERERGTLLLLALTNMGPWRLLMQFWLGQVVLGSVLIATALPSLALAYTFGGVSSGFFLLSLCGMMLLIMQLAAIGVACGCWSKTPMQGAINCIGYLLLLYLGVPFVLLIAVGLLRGMGLVISPAVSSVFSPFTLVLNPVPSSGWRLLCGLGLLLVPVMVALQRAAAAVRQGRAVEPRRWSRMSTAPGGTCRRAGSGSADGSAGMRCHRTIPSPGARSIAAPPAAASAGSS